MKENKKEENWATLYPKDNISKSKLEPYYSELDKALSDDKITNLAVMAPYDSGKSTLLLSFFKNKENEYPYWIRKKNHISQIIENIRNKYCFNKVQPKISRDYEFVSLPNFYKKHENIDNEATNEDINYKLEKEITKQLLFNESSHKFPYSRIIRLKEYSWASIFLCWAFLCILCRSIPIFWENFDKFTAGKLWLQIVIAVIAFLILKKLFHLSSRISVSVNTEFGKSKLNLSMDSNEQKDYFTLFGDELLYYFNHANMNYVIFEDIDRFNSLVIFQKLRELNYNINKQGRHVTFIYTLKDSIFDTESDDADSNAGQLKTKFFDYIISIVPLHSYQNSKRELRKYNEIINNDLQKKFSDRDYYISDNLLVSVGNFISDQREIVEIMHEFKMYIQKSNPKRIDQDYKDKLFAALLYKDMFPGDYDKLSQSKSKLGYLMSHTLDLRKSVIVQRTESINKLINNLNKDIEHAKLYVTRDINSLLEVKYQNALESGDSFYVNYKRFYNNESSKKDFWENGYWKDNSIKNELGLSSEDVDIISIYLEDKDKFDNNILQSLNTKLMEAKKKLFQIQNKVSDTKIGQLIDEILAKDKERDISSFFSDSILESINFIKQAPLLKYLIINNYLDEDFYDYLSPSSRDEMTVRDEDLIRHCISHDVNEEYHVDNPDKVIRELKETNQNFAYAYSSEVAGELIIEKEDQNFLDLLSTVKRNQDFSFIYNIFAYFEVPKYREKKYKGLLFEKLLDNWKEFFVQILNCDDMVLYQFVEWEYQFLFYLDYDEKIKYRLYSLIRKNKLLNQEIYQLELVDNPTFREKILKYEPFEFENLQFATTNKKFLDELIKSNWYIKNEENFAIILSRYRENRDKLTKHLNNISMDFAKDYFVDYYKKINSKGEQVSYDELNMMTKWIDKSDSKQKLDVIDIYANANIVPKLNETQKETFLIKQINIESLISQLSEELLDKLLEQDKLIYNAKIIVTVEKQSNLKNFLEKYLDKYETEENLDEIYSDKSIDFIIIGIKLNKYVDQIINFFDKAVENGEDLPDKIDEKVLKEIINKTSDSETIERIMDLDSKNFTHIIRTMIIRRIFKSFPKKFTKAQISDFVFLPKIKY